MLKNTFCHLTGVGLKREKQLWSMGINSWDCLYSKEIVPFSKSRKLVIEEEIKQAFINLENEVPQYFTDGSILKVV
jgi:hypothetical protein